MIINTVEPGRTAHKNTHTHTIWAEARISKRRSCTGPETVGNIVRIAPTANKTKKKTKRKTREKRTVLTTRMNKYRALIPLQQLCHCVVQRTLLHFIVVVIITIRTILRKMRDERKFIKSFPLLLNFIEAVKQKMEKKKYKIKYKEQQKLKSSSSSCVSFDNYTA